MSQHGTEERSSDWWQTTHRETITGIGRVVLVLPTWKQPGPPLTRAWCLFEIYTAAAAGKDEVDLQVRLPASQRPGFLDAIGGTKADFNVVTDAMLVVESTKAEALLATDQEHIRTAIKASAGGYAQLDTLVKEQLCAWLMQEVMAAAEAPLAAVAADRADREDVKAACNAYHNAAALEALVGKRDAVLQWLDKAEASSALVAGDLHVQLLTRAWQDMAETFNLQNHHGKAVEYHKKVIERRRGCFDAPDVVVAHSFKGMGLAFMGQLWSQEALPCYRKALVIFRELRERHPLVGTVCNELGMLFRAQGQPDQALEYFEMALDVWRHNPGSDTNLELADTHNMMGYALSGMGRHKEALQHFRKSAPIGLKVLGERDPGTVKGYSNRGMLLEQTGSADEALECYSKSIALMPDVLDERDPARSNPFHGTGSILVAKGQCAEALEYYAKALAIRREVLGERHPETAKTYNNMATAFLRQGRDAEALEYYEKAVSIQREIHGEHEPSIAMSYSNMANVLSTQGHHERALEYIMKAVRIFKDFFGEHHPYTTNANINMSSILTMLRASER